MDVKISGDQVASDNSPRLSIDHYQVQHFRARNHGHGSGMNLPFQRLICTEKKLLPRLAARIESTRYLRAAEGAIGQRPTVLTGKGNTLGDTLINDVIADFRESINIGFACAKISALHCVIEKPVNTLAIVRIILSGVDATLRGDGVRATG